MAAHEETNPDPTPEPAAPSAPPFARAIAREARIDDVQHRMSEVIGVANGADAALVDLVADALVDGLWQQWGVHSPTHWLAWKGGLSRSRARSLVSVARRRQELPATIDAMRRGLLSTDQVQVIAAHVPAEYEAAAAELAVHLTVAQLRSILPRYAWDPAAPAPDADDSAEDGDTLEDNSADDGGPEADVDAGADAPAPEPEPEEQRRGAFRWDDTGHGRLSAHLPTDEAMALETALGAARAELRVRHRAEQADEPAPWFSDADALNEIVRSYLARGSLDHPGRDRFLIHAHLDQHPDGTPVLRSHLGPVVPDALRRYLTCDADLRPVFETDGVALSVGRTQRLVPDRARRVIEQRDRGCVVPGCGRTLGLDVHHITHWEEGGATDTPNLCCLCRTHHRQHHLGQLGIRGNADEPGGLTVTDRWGHVLAPAAEPVEVDPQRPPEVVAAERDISTIPYRPATGERVQARDVWLSPRPTRAGPPPPEPPRPEPSPTEPRRPEPPQAGPPTKAGPRTKAGPPPQVGPIQAAAPDTPPAAARPAHPGADDVAC